MRGCWSVGASWGGETGAISVLRYACIRLKDDVDLNISREQKPTIIIFLLYRDSRNHNQSHTSLRIY